MSIYFSIKSGIENNNSRNFNRDQTGMARMPASLLSYAEASEIHRIVDQHIGPHREPNELIHEADRECRPVAAVLPVCASGRAPRKGRGGGESPGDLRESYTVME